MDTDNQVSEVTRLRHQRQELKEQNHELAALGLHHVDKYKAIKVLTIDLNTYKGTCKEITDDLAKVGVDISPSLPFLVRKSTALSCTHDAICCTLLLEMIRCKRHLDVVRAAPQPDSDNLWSGTDAQRAANRLRTATEDRLLKRLFALMDQIRKANKGFFDILPTLQAMGVSRPDDTEEKVGPPHLSKITISGEKHVSIGGSVVLDGDLAFGDAIALAEYRRMLKSRDIWAARQEKLLEKGGDNGE